MATRFSSAFFTVAILMALISGIDALNNRPIIGIMTQPSSNHDYEQYLTAAYAKWVQSAGARVVPIFYKNSTDSIGELLDQINGVVFPGGDTLLKHKDNAFTTYETAVKYIFDYAVSKNDAGDVFPLYGICLGIEGLTYATAPTLWLEKCHHVNETTNLAFTDDALESKLYTNINKTLFEAASKESLVYEYHSWCLAKDLFDQTPEMVDFWQPLAYSVDDTGVTYVNNMEAKKYPFFASQFHPAKNAFDWSYTEAINHSPDAVKFARYLANTFVSYARQNEHAFADTQVEQDTLIYNYETFFRPTHHRIEEYYFNAVSDSNSHDEHDTDEEDAEPAERME